MSNEDDTVTVSMDALMRAVFKARRLCVWVAEQQGSDPGPPDERWAEFERLADAADVDIAKPYLE